MTNHNNTSFGVQGVETYLKDGKYFLRVSSISLESNGDVFKYITDGIELGIRPGDDVALIHESEDVLMDSIYIQPSYRIPCKIRFGWDNVFNLSRDTKTTTECIERHIKRCTIEELENELGCRLEIISEDE